MNVDEKVEARFGGWAYAVNVSQLCPGQEKVRFNETMAVCRLKTTADRIAKLHIGSSISCVQTIIVGGEYGTRYYAIDPMAPNDVERCVARRAEKLACLLCGDVLNQKLAECGESLASPFMLTEEDDALVSKAFDMIRKGLETEEDGEDDGEDDGALPAS